MSTPRPPRKLIGWSAVAIAVVVATAVAVSSGDSEPSRGSLRDQLVDVEWTVATIDWVEVALARPPTFTLLSDGSLVGFDGCNQYGFDLSLPEGWTLTDGTLGLDQQIVSTAMSCTDVPSSITPVADGTRMELDAAGVLTLTSPSGRLYTALAGEVADPG